MKVILTCSDCLFNLVLTRICPLKTFEDWIVDENEFWRSSRFHFISHLNQTASNSSAFWLKRVPSLISPPLMALHLYILQLVQILMESQYVSVTFSLTLIDVV